MNEITIDPRKPEPPTRTNASYPSTLPTPTTTHTHPPTTQSTNNASLFFVGNATTIIEWAGLRIMTDPNFLHAGDHVHLGPGVTAKRLKDPAIPIHDLPHIDIVLLSHYHEDHFDKLVEDSLRRSLPIVTTPHAKKCLQTDKAEGEKFTHVTALEAFEDVVVNVEGEVAGARRPALRVVAMPGKHVPPGPLAVANDILHAVPPTNGWMVELGYKNADNTSSFKNGYRIYISGDTLIVDDLKEIPHRFKDQTIDLMLVHLGGTTIPGPSMPLLMVTMDGKQGVQLMQLINPDVTIPIHFDDYDVFLSPLEDFKEAVRAAGLEDKVVYLERKDSFAFDVRE